jgi:hypothetical protein
MHARCHKLEVGIVCFLVLAFGCESQAQNLTTLDDLSDGAATVSFFVTLRFGEEQIIAQNGALELRARCILGSGTAGDNLQLVVRSTLDGWLATSAGRSTTTANLAGDEVVLFTAAGRPGQGRLSGFGDERLTGAQLALGPGRVIPGAGSWIDRARRRPVQPGLPGGGHGEPDPGCPPGTPDAWAATAGPPRYVRRDCDGQHDRRRGGRQWHLGRSYHRQSHLGLPGHWHIADRWRHCAIARRRHIVDRRPHAAGGRRHSVVGRRHIVHWKMTGSGLTRADRLSERR